MCQMCTRGGRPRAGVIGTRCRTCSTGATVSKRAASALRGSSCMPRVSLSRGRPALVLPLWQPQPSACFDEEADPGALLPVDGDVDEGRDPHQVDAAGGNVAARDGDGLDRLVDGPGADGLDLDLPLAADHPGDGAGDRHGLGGCGDLENFHWGVAPSGDAAGTAAWSSPV